MKVIILVHFGDDGEAGCPIYFQKKLNSTLKMIGNPLELVKISNSAQDLAGAKLGYKIKLLD